MTRKIKHHLTDALLMGYAAGTLPEAFNLVVATHISMCDDCRAALAEFEAVGASVMMDSGAVAMDDGALAAVLDRLDDDDVEAAPPARTQQSGLFPMPLQNYVGGDLPAVRWRKIGGGVSQMVLPCDDGAATVRLLHIPAGTAVPDHGHHGTELTLVLQGAFCDEVDRFGAGDVEVANEDLDHMPVAELGEDCICLAASEAPLRFKGWLPRIAQRIVGI